eukprot:scaffold80353_cov33-Tisochrysis_lutea.AAC.7
MRFCPGHVQDIDLTGVGKVVRSGARQAPQRRLLPRVGESCKDAGPIALEEGVKLERCTMAGSLGAARGTKGKEELCV